MDAHGGQPDIGCVDQVSLDGEGPDPGEHVPAVLPIGDQRLVDAELEEEVRHVGRGMIGRTDHRHLGRERMRAPHAVDLARVGTAHHRQQELVALAFGVGEVVGHEEGTLRGAAAHQHAPHTVETEHG